jgi:hypothetical protein
MIRYCSKLPVLIAFRIELIHREFTTKYVIPGTKNLVKTHTLFQVGQEVQIVGALVDFDVETNMPVVLVNAFYLSSSQKNDDEEGFRFFW